MTLKQTERLLSLLKRHGVSQFKDGDVEVAFFTLYPIESVLPTGAKTIVEPTPIRHSPVPAQAAPPVASTIPHHTNEVQSLLRMSDTDLVDRLFPDHTQPSEE